MRSPHGFLPITFDTVINKTASGGAIHVGSFPRKCKSFSKGMLLWCRCACTHLHAIVCHERIAFMDNTSNVGHEKEH